MSKRLNRRKIAVCEHVTDMDDDDCGSGITGYEIVSLYNIIVDGT